MLGGGRASHTAALRAVGDGWFETTCPDAPAGTRYAFRIDGGDLLPDPASRANPDDVHAPSDVVDPRAYDWHDAAWRGRPWHEAVRLRAARRHVHATKARSPPSIARLDHLVDLGVTAIELMPVADFAGTRNWGYDGVLPFAPDASYGTPEDLKRLIDAAHARGLMVLLDVVYNHFGPEGNYLHAYAPHFFNPAHQTPWGAAINFDGPDNRPVRDFFIHNALYWLEEFNLDGLRLDAVHAIVDTSPTHILAELTATVRSRLEPDRHVHLVLENDDNAARYLERDAAFAPRLATAQWNDDAHHAAARARDRRARRLLRRLRRRPAGAFGRALAEGFVYQGEPVRFPRHAPRRAQRAPAAARLRRFPAEPRPGRQPRLRRAHHRPRRGARGACGNRLPAPRPVAPAAVHGRGIRRLDALPVTSAISVPSSPRR